MWKRPSPNVIKLNVDGASKNNPGEAGIGGIFRDFFGNLIMGFASYLGTASFILAEAKALWLGLFFAQQLGFNSLWIESDSEIIVKLLNDPKDMIWSIEHILDDIFDPLKSLTSFQVSHIHREGNM